MSSHQIAAEAKRHSHGANNGSITSWLQLIAWAFLLAGALVFVHFVTHEQEPENQRSQINVLLHREWIAEDGTIAVGGPSKVRGTFPFEWPPDWTGLSLVPPPADWLQEPVPYEVRCDDTEFASGTVELHRVERNRLLAVVSLKDERGRVHQESKFLIPKSKWKAIPAVTLDEGPLKQENDEGRTAEIVPEKSHER
jgi:hypothetical protein